MNRRNSLKAIAIGSLSVGTLWSACKSIEKYKKSEKDITEVYGRTPDEIIHDAKLNEQQFFTKYEMQTLSVLCNMIIPADSHSGSATDAKVPEFIEFMVKDQPAMQAPIRGGLKWMDIKSLKLYQKSFTAADEAQRFQLLERIAYPEKVAEEDKSGVSFFNTIRNLTATGFFTSEIGIEDLQYMGNTPNAWNGVPDEVLKQYGVEYDQKMLDECLKDEDRGKLMVWN